MKRLISALLAVVMAAAMIVVALSAVNAETVNNETAAVTLRNIKGEAVTQTYYVGDTFTAYTYLNTASLGGISSVNATQDYTSAVLEPVIEYVKDKDDFSYGMVEDSSMKTVFPILCAVSSVANARFEGQIIYNASTPKKAGCAFNTDTSVLAAVTYKVKAAGEAVIENQVTTLALSDTSLTKIVSAGKIINDNFSMPIALTAPTLHMDTVSGSVTGYLQEDGNVTVQLLKDNTVIDSVSGPGLKNYSFTVLSGTYVIRVSKANHVTRDYEIKLNGDLTKNVVVCPKGDVSGDGEISVKDIAIANTCIKGKTLTDYEFACADTNNDKKITIRDLAAINSHIKGKVSLWTV